MSIPDQTGKKVRTLRKWPFMQGILPIDKSRLMPDIIAGITLAALGIPEVMGYTKIINLPVVTGLYTILLPMLIFSLFGSSRHLVVGADSATAAIIAAALISLSISPESAKYIVSVEMIALIVGVMLLLARIFRIGFIADFMSRTVLVGFLSGVGLQVAFKEIPHALGFAPGGQNFLTQLAYTVQHIPQTDSMSLILSLITIGIILLFDKFLPRFPGALLVIVGMIIASATLHWENRGVSLIGKVPEGLPQLSVPRLHWSEILKLLPVSFSCLIVILAQSAATSRAYAVRYRENFNENADLVGLALANLAAGCSNAFVVNGSPTKTAMVDNAGGKSQISQLATVSVVLAVLLFLTKPISYLPNVVLAAVVFLIGVKLIDIRGLRLIYQARRGEFIVAIVAMVAVVTLGVEQGILLAIFLSLIQHVRKSYQPATGIIRHDPQEKWRLEKVSSNAFIEPGIVMYWFGAELFYANANHFSEEIRQIARQSSPDLKWLVIDTGALGSIDYSAGLTVKELKADLARMNVVLALTRADDDLRQDLDQLGLTELIGKDRIFYTRTASLEAYRKTLQEDSKADS
ncbi:MAG: sodium-independent anion transporter [Bacteroidetes bacterium]|nr:MAG: sodium-independent anion transporter [Bacteroidota bacterium]